MSITNMGVLKSVAKAVILASITYKDEGVQKILAPRRDDFTKQGYPPETHDDLLLALLTLFMLDHPEAEKQSPELLASWLLTQRLDEPEAMEDRIVARGIRELLGMVQV